MGYYLHIGWAYGKLHFKKMLMFRASFAINCVSQFLYYSIDFALIWIMVTAFRHMNGWNQYEVMLLFAMNLIGSSIASLFLNETFVVIKVGVQNGTFDDVLTKPAAPLPYLCFQNINPAYLTHIMLSVILLCVGFGNLGTSIDIAVILKLLLGIACGFAVYTGINLFAMAPLFILRRTDSFVIILFFLKEYAVYPLSIFPFVMQVSMTFVLPYAMVGYFPLRSILGKQDALLLGDSLLYLSPVISFAFFALNVWFFHFCLRRYKSSGS
jgi:ABC-2 type transport system permease protein